MQFLMLPMNLLRQMLKFSLQFVEYLKVFFLIFHKLLLYLSLLLSLIILVICLEGLLQHLLSIKWTEPALVEVLGHYLDAIGPFLKYFPDAVGSVVNKLFELLTSLPYVIKVPWTIFFSLLILINEKLFRLFC